MEIIKNYGLLWRRNVVPQFQNGQNLPFDASREWPRNGNLFGIGVRKRREGEVDFAQQIGIYALYDEQFKLVYIGQAGSGKKGLYRRLRSHTLSILSERWSRFSWFGLITADDLIDNKPHLDEDISASKFTILDQVEAVLIAAGEPLRNKQGGRFGKSVVHYRQFKGVLPPESGDEDANGDE